MTAARAFGAITMSSRTTPPADDAQHALRRLVLGAWTYQALYVAAKLGIADLLVEGPRSAEGLAEATGTDPLSLYRVLRALASVGVFAETDGGFELTPMAGYLCSESPQSLRAFAILPGEPWHWRVWGNALHSVRTGEPAFDVTLGQDVWGFFRENPDAAAVFDAVMVSLARTWRGAVVDYYDFPGIEHLVDVGGNRGGLLALVLRANPAMTATLFDLPEVIEQARPVLTEAGVADRCKVVGGDFMEAVPAGDGYLLSHVIHDWDDERAIRILQNCRRSIAPGGRLVLVEMVLGRDGSASSYGPLLDLELLVCFQGRERTEEEYARLLEAGGFELRRVVPTDGEDCAIEAVPA